MPLTDTVIRQSKPPADKPRKLPDGKGLYLLLTVSGGRLWRYDYRFDGKRKTLALGIYPDVSLADARKRHTAAREMLSANPPLDPAEAKQTAKTQRAELAANSFEAVAKEWIARHLDAKAPGHRDKVVRRLERDVLPYLAAARLPTSQRRTS